MAMASPKGGFVTADVNSCFTPLKEFYRSFTGTLPYEKIAAWRYVNLVVHLVWAIIFVAAAALLAVGTFFNMLNAPTAVAYLLDFSVPFLQLLFFWFRPSDFAELVNNFTCCTTCSNRRVWFSRILSIVVPVGAFIWFYFLREYSYNPRDAASVAGAVLRFILIFLDFVNHSMFVLMLLHLRKPYQALRQHIETSEVINYGTVYNLRKECRVQFKCLNSLYSFTLMLHLIAGLCRPEIFIYIYESHTRSCAYIMMAFYGITLLIIGEINQHCCYDLTVCRELVCFRKVNNANFNLYDIQCLLEGFGYEHILTVWGIFNVNRRFVILYLIAVATVSVLYYGNEKSNFMISW